MQCSQFQEVLRRSPDFAGAHYSLAVLLLSNGQLDLAIERLAAAVRYDPTYLEARVQLANALRQRGRRRRIGERVRRDDQNGSPHRGGAVRIRARARSAEALRGGAGFAPGRYGPVSRSSRVPTCAGTFARGSARGSSPRRSARAGVGPAAGQGKGDRRRSTCAKRWRWRSPSRVSTSKL